ncbi:hypothetical protein DL93DRAFT_2103702 [Clavulina sp. PMI_390]|nr:hypothetical protein DL93DRAFT_2103702 [Clavulina sp. PMI_390]
MDATARVLNVPPQARDHATSARYHPRWQVSTTYSTFQVTTTHRTQVDLEAQTSAIDPIPLLAIYPPPPSPSPISDPDAAGGELPPPATAADEGHQGVCARVLNVIRKSPYETLGAVAADIVCARAGGGARDVTGQDWQNVRVCSIQTSVTDEMDTVASGDIGDSDMVTVHKGGAKIHRGELRGCVGMQRRMLGKETGRGLRVKIRNIPNKFYHIAHDNCASAALPAVSSTVVAPATVVIIAALWYESGGLWFRAIWVPPGVPDEVLPTRMGTPTLRVVYTRLPLVISSVATSVYEVDMDARACSLGAAVAQGYFALSSGAGDAEAYGKNALMASAATAVLVEENRILS